MEEYGERRKARRASRKKRGLSGHGLGVKYLQYLLTHAAGQSWRYSPGRIVRRLPVRVTNMHEPHAHARTHAQKGWNKEAMLTT